MGVDNTVDTVDNSGSTGDDQGFSPPIRPPAPSRRPPNSGPPAESVLHPGDEPDPPFAASGATGSDLAREALRAAREAAAKRGRAPGQSVRGPRRAGRGARRRGWSGAGPDERDPQPLGRLAARLAMDRGWQDRLTSASVFGRWAELVGSEVAEHATPLALRDGELTVAASSTAWATQLRLLQRQLLVKIAAGVGPNVVRKLKVAGPAAPSWRKGHRHTPGRGPRDTYG
jgi:predicted nucleic acid-binding Zn ribbon protein